MWLIKIYYFKNGVCVLGIKNYKNDTNGVKVGKIKLGVKVGKIKLGVKVGKIKLGVKVGKIKLLRMYCTLILNILHAHIHNICE